MQEEELFESKDFVSPCKRMTKDWDESMWGDKVRREYWDTLLIEAIKRNKTLYSELSKFGVGNPNASGIAIFLLEN